MSGPVNQTELLTIIQAYAPEVAEELLNDILSSGVLEGEKQTTDEIPRDYRDTQGGGSIVMTLHDIERLYQDTARNGRHLPANTAIRITTDRRGRISIDVDRDSYARVQDYINPYDYRNIRIDKQRMWP